MLEVSALGKIYADSRMGVVQALADVSFTARPGSVVGVLGMNGAGKSTLLRCLATLLKPSSGVIKIGGLDLVADPEAARRRLGVLSTSTALPRRLSGREILHYFGELHGLSDARQRQVKVEELIMQFELGSYADRYTQELSTGQRQRINICRALIHDPQLLIMDEATTGLDPVARARMISVLRRLRSPDRILLYATHNLDEVTALCDQVLLIHHGRLAVFTSLSAFPAAMGAGSVDEVFVRLAEQDTQL